MSRILINYNLGIIEAEGEDTFVKSIYDEHKHLISNKSSIKTPARNDEKLEIGVEEKVSKKKVRKSNAKNNSLKYVDGLDINGLKSFYNQKKPTSGLENNVVFIYFLSKNANINEVTVDHIYTCYKVLGLRVPTAIQQSLLDASHKKNWINTSSMSDLKVTTHGENFVEHDLPKDVSK
jgi:hypothetical protein